MPSTRRYHTRSSKSPEFPYNENRRNGTSSSSKLSRSSAAPLGEVNSNIPAPEFNDEVPHPNCEGCGTMNIDTDFEDQHGGEVKEPRADSPAFHSDGSDTLQGLGIPDSSTLDAWERTEEFMETPNKVIASFKPPQSQATTEASDATSDESDSDREEDAIYMVQPRRRSRELRHPPSNVTTPPLAQNSRPRHRYTFRRMHSPPTRIGEMPDVNRETLSTDNEEESEQHKQPRQPAPPATVNTSLSTAIIRMEKMIESVQNFIEEAASELQDIEARRLELQSILACDKDELDVLMGARRKLQDTQALVNRINKREALDRTLAFYQ